MTRIGRRGVLGTVAMAAMTGCQEAIGLGGNDDTVLGEPERDLSASVHPTYGDDLPAVTVPDPILDEDVSTDQFAGERAVLLTFFYTHCPDGMCPALILRLRRAQERAAEAGFGDDAAFLAITFDPERDTADRLETYAGQQGVDLETGNWHFLRPESFDAGAELIEEHFGLVIEKQPTDEYDDLEYVFPHYNLILLANADGIIERSYPNGTTVDVTTVVDDFETVATD